MTLSPEAVLLVLKILSDWVSDHRRLQVSKQALEEAPAAHLESASGNRKLAEMRNHLIEKGVFTPDPTRPQSSSVISPVTGIHKLSPEQLELLRKAKSP